MAQRFFLASILFFALMTVSARASAACGEVAVSKGDVKIEVAKDKKVSAAPQGTKVCAGDTIISGPQSRAKVKMEDGNELNISPDSRILIETYEYKPSDNKKKVMLNVLYGKVRAATREENMYNDKDKSGQANTFQVRTKSAVAGVRGTDFLTSFDRMSSKSEVLTFKGTVEVGQPGPGGQMMNPVKVQAGQKTEALPGAPPEPPRPVPPKEMEQQSRETKADTASNKEPSRDSAARDDGKKDDGKKEDGKRDDGRKDDGKKDDTAKRDDGKRDDTAKRDDGKRDDGKRDDSSSGGVKRDDASSGGKKDDSAKRDGGSNGNANGNGSGNGGGSGSSASGSGTNGGSANNGGTAGGGTNAMGPKSGQGAAPGSTDGRSPASENIGSPMPGGPAPGGTAGAGPSGPPLSAAPPPPPPPPPPMNIGGSFAGVGAPPPMPVLPPPVFIPPTCDLCNQSIENGPAKVNVRVIIGN